jgi:hypothetical protein
MTTLTVIALDPGGTTGWSMFRTSLIEIDGALPEMYDAKWTQGQLGPHEHHSELYTFLELMTTQRTYIITESFEYRNRARAGLDLSSKEYIGVTKLFVQQRGLEGFYYEQTASQAGVGGHGFVKDGNIKKLGLWNAGHVNRHANDATRHLLWWLINSAPVSIKDIMRPQLLEKGWK